MGDAGLLEFIPGDDEAVAGIKRHRVLLRIEDRAPMPSFAGQFDEQCEQRGTDAAPSPWPQHRDAPDMAIGQQSSASDRIPVPVRRERMRAKRIDSVPLERLGNPLLDDENASADCTERAAIARPIGQSQRELGRRAHA